MNIRDQSQVLKKVSRILAGKNVPVYLEGFQPRVEYSTVTKQPVAIYLPELPEGSTPQLINAINGYIDHECGHILESSSDDICDTTKSKLWHFIHNCIEDPRVNARMSDRFPGCERNIRAGYQYLFDRKMPNGQKNPYTKEAIDSVDTSDEDALKDAQVNYSSLWFAKKSNCRFNRDIYDTIGADKLFKSLEAKMNKRYLDALGRCHSVEEVKEATDYFVDFFHKEFDESGSGKSKGGSSKAPKSKAEKGRLDSAEKLEDTLAEAIKTEIEHLAKKDEKNIHWSNRFDIIKSRISIGQGSKSDEVRPFEDRVKTVTNYLNKDLRRLLESRNRRWWVGGFKAGKLSQKSLYTVPSGNDRIFAKKSEIRDVKATVSLLIDLSGSMNGTKAKIACESAYAFALVLEQLKVPYEIWGFTTVGASKEKVEAYNDWAKTVDPAILAKVINMTAQDILYKFKGFDENFDMFSKKALICASKSKVTMSSNEDSLHVKAALERLSGRAEEQKTLFVFSDGQPAFMGDSRKSMEMLKWLDKHSKSNYGVDIFGIGILSEQVKHYYKHHKVVKDISELPAALFGFLKTRI